MSDRLPTTRSIALALLIAQLGALAHGSLARHVTAATGAVVDACPQQHLQALSTGAALADHEDAAAHHHEVRHCPALALLRGLAPFGTAPEVGVLQRFVGLAVPQPQEHRAFTVVPMLRLAPKASPPPAA